MRKLLKLLLVGLFTSLLITACDSALSLSDEGEVSNFSIKQYSPSEIKLSEPYVNKDSIIIPLNYGRYYFPLKMSAQIECSPGIKLRNINPDSIQFNQPEEVIVFYLQTESGYPRKYYIKLQEAPRSSASSVLSFKPLAYSSNFNTLLSDSAAIHDDSDGKRIVLYMPIGGYPIQIKPEIQLSDTAKLVGFEPESWMTFNRESDIIPLQVQAANGSTSTWNVEVKRGYEPSADDYIPTPVFNVINLLQEEVSATADINNQVTRIEVDQDQKKVFLTVKNRRTGEAGSALKFPINCSLSFPQSEPRMTVGYHSGEALSFSSLRANHSFFLIHTLENYKQRWNIQLKQWLNNDNSVTSFNITRSAPASIEIGENVQINNETGSIIIPIESGKQYFPLTINATLTIPSGAVLEGAALKQTFTFADLYKKCSFTVKAEDGTAQEYVVSLRYAGEKNNAADIESFRITEYTSVDNRVKINTIATIDPTKHTVEIEVLDWVKYFPLRIKAVVSISDGAVWTNQTIQPTEWITFESILSNQSYTLQSESGTTTNNWVIRLKNSQPPKSNSAELLNFTVSNLATGFTLDEVVIDQNRRTVKLLMPTVGSALSFVPNIQISPKAKLIGISDGIKENFTDLTPKTFAIQSESEEVTQVWTLIPLFAPQIGNGTLDSWSDGYSPTSWATANNSFIKGTSRTAGVSGNAALLESRMADILGIKEIAAGSLFLGRFEFNIGLKDQPKKMTFFGIPFKGRPAAMNVDLSYESAEMSNVNGPLGRPDKATATIMLLRWRGTGNIVYHEDEENADLIDVIGVSANEVSATGGWKNMTFPIQYDPKFNGVTPTHIHIVFSSSYRGDYFEAGIGSKLKIDNVKLAY